MSPFWNLRIHFTTKNLYPLFSVVSVPCDVIEAPTCAPALNYLSTFATTQSSYETTMQTISLITSCHANAQTFFCSALLPECELSYGLVPCRHFCEEVALSCYASYEALFGQGSWQFYCTDYPVGGQEDSLLCEKGNIFVVLFWNNKILHEFLLEISSLSKIVSQ